MFTVDVKQQYNNNTTKQNGDFFLVHMFYSPMGYLANIMLEIPRVIISILFFFLNISILLSRYLNWRLWLLLSCCFMATVNI